MVYSENIARLFFIFYDYVIICIVVKYCCTRTYPYVCMFLTFVRKYEVTQLFYY